MRIPRNLSCHTFPAAGSMLPLSRSQGSDENILPFGSLRLKIAFVGLREVFAEPFPCETSLCGWSRSPSQPWLWAVAPVASSWPSVKGELFSLEAFMQLIWKLRAKLWHDSGIPWICHPNSHQSFKTNCFFKGVFLEGEAGGWKREIFPSSGCSLKVHGSQGWVKWKPGA